MDDQFLADAVSSLVGTFVGTALTVLATWIGFRVSQARNETDKLQRLIDRIYRSRALVAKPTTARRFAPLSEEERAHQQRVTSAIFTVRHHIEDAANTFRPRAKAVSVLDDMYVATLEYLTATETDTRDYINESMKLREALLAAEARLKQLHRGLVLREPGGIVAR